MSLLIVLAQFLPRRRSPTVTSKRGCDSRVGFGVEKAWCLLFSRKVVTMEAPFDGAVVFEMGIGG